MDLTLRYGTADDFARIAELDGASFGFQYSEQDRQDALLIEDPTRVLMASAGDRLVGISGEYPFTMTVPGGTGGPRGTGRTVEMAGITWVSVEVTHRGRGVLRAMIERQLRDEAARGIPVAALAASQAGIYGRFGFGVAEQVRTVSVDRRLTRLRDLVARPDVVRASTPDDVARLPAIHDRWRASVPGAVDRTEAWWQFLLLDREFQRNGASNLFHLIHPDGYLSYRVHEGHQHGIPEFTCRIVDYAVITPQAHAELWQVLLGMDLFATIETTRMPVDDPLPYRVTDPRQVRTVALYDGLWVRPLDVPVMLSARRYALDIDTVLAVADPLFGDGTYRLQGGPDGAECARTDRAPQVRLGASELGALYLGGVRIAPLARAGLVGGEPGALARLDRAMLSDVAPCHGTSF